MAAIEQELHERADSASLSCPAMPCSLMDTHLKKPQKGATLSHFVSRKTLFRAGIVLHISFCCHDIRYGRPLFGEPKGFVAHVHRKTPGNFCRCSLPPGEPFLRHPTRRPWSSNNSPRCSMSEEEIPLSQHDQLAMAIVAVPVLVVARQNERNRQISPVLHMSVRAHVCEKWRSVADWRCKRRLDAAGLRRRKVWQTGGLRSSPAAPKRRNGALDPRKNRHFPPFFMTFSTIYTGFFCEFAHLGANSRKCSPGKRQFFEPRANWVRAAILNELPFPYEESTSFTG